MSTIVRQMMKLSSTVMETRIIKEKKRRKSKANIWIYMKHIIKWDI
jgi:hypothetical protein